MTLLSNNCPKSARHPLRLMAAAYASGHSTAQNSTALRTAEAGRSWSATVLSLAFSRLAHADRNICSAPGLMHRSCIPPTHTLMDQDLCLACSDVPPPPRVSAVCLSMTSSLSRPVPPSVPPFHVHVGVCAVCAVCHSDLHPYHEREKGLLPGTIVGHEFTGVIEQCGSEVGGWLGFWDLAPCTQGRESA